MQGRSLPRGLCPFGFSRLPTDSADNLPVPFWFPVFKQRMRFRLAFSGVPGFGRSMKFFAIGDGNKRISCPDRYCADLDGSDATKIWDPAVVEMPIRVMVLTIQPKDKREKDAAFRYVVRQAEGAGRKPVVVDRLAIYARGREPSSESGYVLYFWEAGFGNHVAIFSLTVSERMEGSAEFQRIESDLSGMMQSLVERQAEEQFGTALFERNRKSIQEALCLLDASDAGDAWAVLQRSYDAALASSDRILATEVGLALGELMRREVPALGWSVRTDDWGRSLALDLGDTGAANFPVEMVLQRFDRHEEVRLRELAGCAYDALEELLQDGG
jgi:hypothetical protein